MSVFDNDGTNQSAEETITENFLENLVGEGKKFTDPEALAKGKYEADKFVKNLERQNAELREDLEKTAKLDELMELVRKQNESVVQPVTTPVVDPSDTSSDQMTPEALKALVEKHVTERETAAKQEKNIAEANRMMEEKFGDTAGRVLVSRAAEVGMAVDDVKQLASQNPKAFAKLMGLDGDNKTPTGGLVGGTVRSESVVSNATARNAAYYKKLRKENKGAYYNPKVQTQMIKDAEDLGAAFYSN
jgi:hypothetical protein